MTFFSGTDVSTLQKEGTDRNHFVSLIVCNAGTYTAGITKQVTLTKNITETSSFSTFGGTEQKENKTYQEISTKIIWYELDIQKEAIQETHQELAERIDKIKIKKTQTQQSQYPYSQHLSPNNQNNDGKYRQGSLFPYDEEPITIVTTTKKNENPNKEPVQSVQEDVEDIPFAGQYDKKIISRAAKQIITGQLLLPNEKTIDLKKWIENMQPLYKARFGSLKNEDNSIFFEEWAESHIEFVMRKDLDPAFVTIGDDEEMSTKAFDLLCLFSEFPSNEYLDVYINILNNYVL